MQFAAWKRRAIALSDLATLNSLGQFSNAWCVKSDCPKVKSQYLTLGAAE